MTTDPIECLTLLFPREDMVAIECRLEAGQPLYTTRTEPSEYNLGMVVQTFWGKMRVTEALKLPGLDQHPCPDELTQAQRESFGSKPLVRLKLEPIQEPPQDEALVTAYLKTPAGRDTLGKAILHGHPTLQEAFRRYYIPRLLAKQLGWSILK